MNLTKKNKKKEFRVIAKMSNHSHNCGSQWNEVTQVLQEKTTNWFGKKKWKTIDFEHVPNFAWISVACLGEPPRDWESKFANIPNCNFVNPQKIWSNYLEK